MRPFSIADVSRQSRHVVNRLIRFGLAIGLVILMTAVLFLLRENLNTSIIALLFLIPVIASTFTMGLVPGVISALAAFLAYNYFFLQPYYTFIVHESQDIIALIIFLSVAVFNSQLVGRARLGMEAAVARERETTRLYELSLDLAGAGSLKEIATALARKTFDTFRASHLEISIGSIYGEPSFQLYIPNNNPPGSKPDISIPLETIRAAIGEIRLWLDEPVLTPTEERLLRAFAVQGTLALERTALANTETRARVLEESDRLKS
ncbi:MAG: DUF4118 domain-containing protein, partial [Chloroflexi bacterium]